MGPIASNACFELDGGLRESECHLAMKIPPAKRRIDVDAAQDAIMGGESVAAFARRAGFTGASVRHALRRSGIRVHRRPLMVRDAIDRHLVAIWRSVRSRCEDPRSPQFPRYGARGLQVCEQWKDFTTFRDWSRAHGYEIGRCLALTARSLGYSPWNCVWTARSEAIRLGVLSGKGKAWGIRAFGETKSAQAWAQDSRAKVCGETLRVRIRSGMAPELAITLRPDAKRSAGGAANKGVIKSQNAAMRPTIDWERVRKLHVTRGLSIADTALELGASYHGVLRGLRARGWMRELATPVHEVIHGKALHKAWSAMHERCTSPSHPDYARIGAVGISVAKVWTEFAAFHAWALRAGHRKGLVCTRLDRSKDYGPDNCAWLPRRESSRFHRPTKVSRKPRWTITAFGETKGPTAWTRDARCTVTFSGLIARLKGGAKPEDAIAASNQRADVDLEGRRLITAFGTKKSLAAWSRDKHAKVGMSSIAARIDRGIAPAAAITSPPFEVEGERPPRGRKGRQLHASTRD